VVGIVSSNQYTSTLVVFSLRERLGDAFSLGITWLKLEGDECRAAVRSENP
jgi:hypothetical protein